MPLRDHFRPPLRNMTPPEGVHGTWAVKIVEYLNQTALPADFRAVPLIHLGGVAEVDVGTFENVGEPLRAHDDGNGVAVAVWAPPKPLLETEIGFTDQDLFEVQVLQGDYGKLVAAIELVSPSNKDRPENRRNFSLKCASYLNAGIAVVVVDIVTERTANLHAEMMELLQPDNPADTVWRAPSGLAACAYRTMRRQIQRAELQGWLEPLALGAVLPNMPLWLREDLAVSLDLELPYSAACATLRIPS